ncbi:RraA family protein [Devosia litorisediminis]|uniref:RraA family protein n=1 Tax=Devosia litorisediminis TaxID=2829817 RepID=UPI0031F39B88
MIGFRILPRLRKVDQRWIDAFSGLPVATVSDAMSRMFAGGCGLRPLHKSGQLCGAALTVRTRPGDNLVLHKALDMAEPGDVIVVDGGGDVTNALIGELMIAHAKKRGVVGIVIHGAVRDSQAIAEDTFPVFAQGITHRGPYKDGPGEINVPVSIGGMVVSPGDLVVGDADGVVSVSVDDVEAIHLATSAKYQAELAQMERIQAGQNDRSWVDVALRERGCSIESDTGR